MTLSLPEGACDCHVHVIGPQDAYPMLPGRRYTPGPAGVQALHGHLRRLGLSRAVIVQPSVYGVDNRLLEESLAQPRGAVRGVAVLGPEVDDGELARLHAAGVRGVRVNLESAGASDPDALARLLSAWAGRVRGQGWHLQVYASCRALAAAAPRVRKLGVPLVFDHFAMTPAQTAPDDHELRAILDLVREGAAYVKLSAPYRIGGPGGADAVTALARTFAAANPDRLLWASDWPHTNRAPGAAPHEVSPYRDVPPGRLLEEIAAWLPDAALRRRVLADNPARLYGF